MYSFQSSLLVLKSSEHPRNSWCILGNLHNTPRIST